MLYVGCWFGKIIIHLVRYVIQMSVTYHCVVLLSEGDQIILDCFINVILQHYCNHSVYPSRLPLTICWGYKYLYLTFLIRIFFFHTNSYLYFNLCCLFIEGGCFYLKINSLKNYLFINKYNSSNIFLKVVSQNKQFCFAMIDLFVSY